MFQTGIHIALQSQASQWLTWLMLQVTATGYDQFVVFIVITVLFGVSLRKGFLLFHIIIWTSIVTEIAKDIFALPRPFFADSRIDCLDPHYRATGAFRAGGARDFFSLPPQPVIDAFRMKGISFGFPSGHTSGAVATWGGLAVVFRRRALAWLAVFMVALIAFTRIYLGVHFLADILGGALLGGLVLIAAWRLWRDDGRREGVFAAMRSAIALSLPGALALFLLFVLPLLLALLGLASPDYAGFIVGMNTAFALVSRAGLPGDEAPAWARLGRVLLAGLLFWLFSLALRLWSTLAPAGAGSAWGTFLATALGTFLVIWGGIRASQRLGLYPEAEEAPAR